MEPSVPSLRQRCFRDVATLAALTWLLLSIGLLMLVRVQGRQMFDDALRDRAQLVLAFTQHEVEEIKDGKDSAARGVDQDLVGNERGTMLMQVWNARGELAFRSPGAPLAPITQGADGFRDLSLDGVALRAYSQWSMDREFRVLVAEQPDTRDRYALATSVLAAAAMLLGLAGFLGRLKRTLRHGLAPLDHTAQELCARTPGDLQPVSAAAQPQELVPVIEAFNQMIARVQRALLHEQRFTADAAHELKTPLASLTVLLHNARHAGDDAARQQALQTMQQVIEQSTHLVDQLLALARYDHAPESFNLAQAVDLASLARQVGDELQPLVRGRSAVLQLQLPQAAWVPGNHNALRVLLRNLLDNAVLHGGPQARIELVVQADAGLQQAVIEVHDTGPGVPEGWHARVLGRFVRPPVQAQAQAGSGLGLAICERIVHLHGGTLALARSGRLGGTVAVVTLPMQRSGALPGAGSGVSPMMDPWGPSLPSTPAAPAAADSAG